MYLAHNWPKFIINSLEWWLTDSHKEWIWFLWCGCVKNILKTDTT